MKITRPIAIVIAAVIIIAAVGAAYVLWPKGDGGGSNEVRVGYLAGDLHQLSRVVMTNTSAFNGTSLFEKYGIKVSSPSPFSAGGAIMDAFAANTIDMAWLGAPPTIQKSLNLGVDVKIVAVANDEGSSIIAKKTVNGVPINSFADLKGKVIATPGPSSIQHLLFLEVAKEANLTVVQLPAQGPNADAVNWVTIAPKDQKAAIMKGENVSYAAGRIDAAVGWEPYGSDSLLDPSGSIQVLEWSADVWPNHPCCVLAVKTSFANDHPDLVSKVIAAHIDANKWIADATSNKSSANYSKLVAMGGQFSNRNASVVESALNHTVFTYEMTGGFKQYLENFTNDYIDLGIVQSSKISERGYSSVSDFVNKTVDTKYLQDAQSVKPVS